jgi:hypothetical protein
MAWTKTANIKGEQGGAGTRSTEIIIDNPDSKPSFPEVILDGDIGITSDGIIMIYHYPNLGFETGDTTDWEIDDPDKIRVVDASDASLIKPYEGKYMLKLSPGGTAKIKEDVFTSVMPEYCRPEELNIAVNIVDDQGQLYMSLYDSDGIEFQLPHISGPTAGWREIAYYLPRYIENFSFKDFRTICFYSEGSDVRIDAIDFVSIPS